MATLAAAVAPAGGAESSAAAGARTVVAPGVLRRRDRRAVGRKRELPLHERVRADATGSQPTASTMTVVSTKTALVTTSRLCPGSA